MRVLVTGGAGFIGNAVCAQLLKQNIQVRSLDLWPNPNPKVESFTGSVLDRAVVMDAVTDCDAVIHLAAMIGVFRTDAQPLQCMDVNLQGSVTVFEACAKEKVKKIVFSSSSEVYGDANQDMLSEDDALMPKSIYAVSKIAAEGYLRSYAEKYKFDYSIVRFFNVYGPGQVAEFVVPRFIKAVLAGKSPTVYGHGEQIRSFCYMEDAAFGVYKALVTPEANGEVFNIGNTMEPITIKALAEKVIEISGKDIPIRYVELENSDRQPHREIFLRRPNLNKAESILNYSPSIELSEGLKRVIDVGNVPESPFRAMGIDI